MKSLKVAESQVKVILGKAAELVGRLKLDGQLTGYSPLSRILELEGLAGGIASNRSMWMSLRIVAPSYYVVELVDGRLHRNPQVDVPH